MTAEPPDPDLVGAKVLVVEDDPASARLTSAILRRMHCEVRVATTASDAATMVFDGYRPALVLMDLDLPDLTGMDLTKVFRSIAEIRDVPILAVTASGLAFGEKAAMSAGCDAFIGKPLDPETFPKIVATYLRPGWKRRRGAPSLSGRYEAILDAIPKAIGVVRPTDLTLVYANRRFEQITGYTVRAVVGTPIAVVNPDGTQGSIEMREAIQRQLDADSEAVYEVARRRPDGSSLWVQVTASRLPDAELGDLWLLVFDDITERKQAEQALQQALARSELRIASLSEAGVLAVVTVDPAGRVVDANDVFLRLIGWSRDDVAQRRLHTSDFALPEYQDLDDAAARVCSETGYVTPYKKEYRRKDGTRVPVLVGGAAVKPEVFIGFAVDLSETSQR